MDFADKYKDYTGTFLVNANQVKQNNDEHEEGAKNGQLPTNRQNGDMWVTVLYFSWKGSNKVQNDWNGVIHYYRRNNPTRS